MSKFCILLPRLFIAPAFGQGFDAGVKGGVPITQFFDTGGSGSVHGGSEYLSATRRYTFGVSGEWCLTHAFGFELDAMYHRLDYTGNVIYASNGYSTSVLHVTGNSRDFPLLAKYRFGRVIRPYAAAGGTLRYIGRFTGKANKRPSHSPQLSRLPSIRVLRLISTSAFIPDWLPPAA